IAAAQTADELKTVLLHMIGQAEKLIAAQSRPKNPLVKKAVAHIRLHYTSDITLESIAAGIPVNPSHLSRIFKKETGEAITEYINKFRVEKAKELLLTSEILVYEAASTVGFKDSTYFSQVFKKYTGMSPKDFKSARP
ncbi:MAG: AraC family transcriptional regulator, partial [Clostridiales bacterium]|nr:AraC family transcriptional regulator [Clostridiales bacterium]